MVQWIPGRIISESVDPFLCHKYDSIDPANTGGQAPQACVGEHASRTWSASQRKGKGCAVL
jgi:hypothetical protein